MSHYVLSKIISFAYYANMSSNDCMPITVLDFPRGNNFLKQCNSALDSKDYIWHKFKADF